MPGNFDDFIIEVLCPACGTAMSAGYGVLRRDPRVICPCGVGFAIYLDRCPVAEADLLCDTGRWNAANDNGGPPHLVSG